MTLHVTCHCDLVRDSVSPLLVRRAQIKLPGPSGTVLVDEVEVGLPDTLWIQFLLPLGIIPGALDEIGDDSSINDHMSNMNILLPKLLTQALAQRPQSMLTSRKRACHGVTPNTCGRAGEDERPSLPVGIGLLNLLECKDRLAREGERSTDVNVDGLRDVFVCDIKEWLEDAVPGVVHGDFDLRSGPLRFDLCKRSFD